MPLKGIIADINQNSLWDGFWYRYQVRSAVFPQTLFLNCPHIHCRAFFRQTALELLEIHKEFWWIFV